MLFSVNTYLFVVVQFVLMLLAAEAGYRLGHRNAGAQGELARSQVAAIEAAILTLFGLLLAFTFSMAASRYEMRKQFVVEEANALGTAYLRADLARPEQREKMRAVLRSYLAARLAEYRNVGASSADIDRYQKEFWSLVTAEIRFAPTSPSLSLLLSAANDVFDDREKQVATFENRVPEPVLHFLCAFSVLVLGLVGYLNGLGGGPQRRLTILFAVAVALTMFLVLDLDRPRRGLIIVNHPSFDRLQKAWDTDR